MSDTGYCYAACGCAVAGYGLRAALAAARRLIRQTADSMCLVWGSTCKHATSMCLAKAHCACQSLTGCRIVRAADRGADASAVDSEGKGIWALAAEVGVNMVASLLARGFALPEGSVEHLVQLLQAAGMKDTQVRFPAMAPGLLLDKATPRLMLHVKQLAGMTGCTAWSPLPAW